MSARRAPKAAFHVQHLAADLGRLQIRFARRATMNLSAPKQVTFWIAVVLAIVAVLGALVTSLGITAFAFWLLAIGFVILAAGNLFEGL